MLRHPYYFGNPAAMGGGVTPTPTLYYIDQGSGLWEDSANWFEDQSGTIPHGATPTASNNCEINAGNIVDEVPSSGYVNVVNNGTVTTNNGTATHNESGGTITYNNGTIDSNVGTVTSNEIGAIVINNNGGTVATNSGAVYSNNSGTITSNCGTVVNNYGYAGPC